MFYHTRGEHVNHYTTNVVDNILSDIKLYKQEQWKSKILPL